MPKSNALSESDRDFLRLLAEAAATNPFSDEYFDLQLKISGCDALSSAEEQYEKIVEHVSNEVQRMEAAGAVIEYSL